MNKQIKESWNRIKDMIKDRDIQSCLRMNTNQCTHAEFSPFPDPENSPISYDVSILLRCEKCIYNIIRGQVLQPQLKLTTPVEI